MVLLVKTKKAMTSIEDSIAKSENVKGEALSNDELDELKKIEPSSTMSAIAKLLPADAIAFFAMLNKYILLITDPSELANAIWIGLFAGIVYTFLVRLLVLLKERDKLKKPYKNSTIIVQVLITCINFAIYYSLQMNFLRNLGSPEYVTFLTLVIGALWLAAVALFSYYLTP